MKTVDKVTIMIHVSKFLRSIVFVDPQEFAYMDLGNRRRESQEQLETTLYLSSPRSGYIPSVVRHTCTAYRCRTVCSSGCFKVFTATWNVLFWDAWWFVYMTLLN